MCAWGTPFISMNRGSGIADRVVSSRDLGALCCSVPQSSHVQLFRTLGTVAHQAPLSLGFPKQESWRGLPCPPPGDLPYPGIWQLVHWQADSLPLSHLGSSPGSPRSSFPHKESAACLPAGEVNP